MGHLNLKKMKFIWIPILLIWSLTALMVRADADDSVSEIGDGSNLAASNETENESFEIQPRQDLGYYKCLSHNACGSICYRDYFCDFSKGICVCFSGAVTGTIDKCELAPAKSTCARQYVDCVSQKGSFSAGQSKKFLCSVDESQTEKLCVHDEKLGYDRCRNNQVCKVICKGGYGQCDFMKGMCTCSIGLGTAIQDKCTPVTDPGKYRRCYEYAGRYSNKYTCKIEDQTICVHELFKPDTCRPLYEVCEKNEHCCQKKCHSKYHACVKGDPLAPPPAETNE